MDENESSSWGRNKETIYETGRGAARGYYGQRSFDWYIDNSSIIIILFTVYIIILPRQ
jgi:hypothetical protein